MKYRLLDLLQPISCTGHLHVIPKLVEKVPFADTLHKVKCDRYCAFKNCMIKPGAVSPADCNECYTNEIIDGELVEESGKRYPIISGIPRIFSGEMSDFLEKNKATFSLEWKMFQFGQRNWGQDIEFRRQLFLKGMGVNKESLKNKLIVDAGCGSGLLSMSMADDFGMEVLALDLGTGIEKAYEHNTNPYVYFVQGSVLEPPIQDNVADFLYCAGVLIHLPDTKMGFQVLPRILKEAGRYFIWVYHPIDKQHHPDDLLKMKFYKWIRDNLTSQLPIKAQYMIYLTWTVLFVIKQKIFNIFVVTKDDRTWQEKMQDFIDMFSPIYQHRHTEEEVLAWYEELGFMNVDLSYQEKYGFGARGDKRRQINVSTPLNSGTSSLKCG
jgi:ubiquinone/menaquinone biosynthesis C-methylase UbiE/uncharacterized protein YbaR (Trm112 family)